VFIGHFAVGFASKRWAPRTSLAVLLAAPLLADIVWPVLVLLGIEKVQIIPGATVMTPLVFDSYPWSHSLLLDAVWAALFAGAVWMVQKDRTAAIVVALGVLSHWVLDWISHAPDMPLWPGGPREGLGLWNHVAGTVLVEVVLFTVGVALYATATRARDRVGHLALWSLVLLLGALYVASIVSEPPTSVAPIAGFGIAASVVFPLWAWWLDRHREPARRK
jgi:membrane-bound metal-dependent hydrolase YbcI (DUF457 family)